MIYQLSKTIIQLLRASTTILRELCLNRLSGNKSFFSLTQKRAGRSGCQPFYNSSLPSPLSRLLTQTTKEIVYKLLFFTTITHTEKGTEYPQLRTNGEIWQMQHNYVFLFLFSFPINYIFITYIDIFLPYKKKVYKQLTKHKGSTDQLMYFQGTELRR